MVDLVVLDMAGTTVTDKDFVAKAFVTAFRDNGFTVTHADANPLMGYPKPVAIQMILEKAGEEFDDAVLRDIHDDFINEMMAFYEDSPNVQPMPGAEALFFYLQERGIRVALNTGFSREIAQVIMYRFQWLERGLVDDYIASDEVPQGRPYAYMINELKARTGLSEDAEVMKVGDTPVDIQEGRAAGCRYVVAVATGAFTKEELREHGPTHLITSLSQVPAILEQTVATHA